MDHVQSDPFAPPSRFRARLSLDIAKIPMEMYDTKLKYVSNNLLVSHLIDAATKAPCAGRQPSVTFSLAR